MSPKMPRLIYEFLRDHCDTINMLVVGFSDYVASRACLRFNCIFQAAILGEQSLEKAFKAGIRLSGDITPFKDMNHNLSNISQELQKTAKWFDFSAHDELLGLLEHHFRKSRYPSTKEDKHYLECGQGISRKHFDDLDCVVLDYYDALPVSNEVKFSLGVYGAIHNRKVLKDMGIPSREWDALSWENMRLSKTLGDYEDRADEYFDRLKNLSFPGLMKRMPI